MRSQVRRIIEHCLKLEYSRAVEPRGGSYDSVIDARTQLDDDLEEQLPRLWTQARSKADNGLRRFGEPDAADMLPAGCPYTLDDLFADGRYRESLRPA